MPSPDSQRGKTEIPRRAPRPFSLESFKRPASAKPSNVPALSPSTRRPLQISHTRRTTLANQNIAKIDNDASHSIRAAHTILDPAAIIKELIENALDAGATRIDVRVRGKGALDTITVSDNGHGISESDYHSLCLPSTTSKISSFSDLDKLATFGFRGEALSAICAIAKVTTVTTRTPHEKVATALSYSNDGSLASQAPAPRPAGTTVQVESVFHALPVRQKDAVKNHTREVSRCVAVVQALALISVNTRVELKLGGEVKVANLPAMKEAQVIPSSLGKVCLSALRHNAKSVLGARVSNALIEVSADNVCVVKLPPFARAMMRANGQADSTDTTALYGCHGLISKASLDADGSGGRAKSSYQYIFVNRRPVDFPRLTRTVKELYRRATGMNSAAPVVILNLILPAWSCDVNLAPDKRVVCVHEEDRLISGILSQLEDIWIPTKATTIPVQKDSNLTHLIQSSPTVDAGNKIASQPIPTKITNIPVQKASTVTPTIHSGPKVNSGDKAASQSTPDVQMFDIPEEPEVEDYMNVPKTRMDIADVHATELEGGGEVTEHNATDKSTKLSSDPIHVNSNFAQSITHSKNASEAVEVTPNPSDGELSVTPPDAQLLSFSPVQAVGEKAQPATAGSLEEGMPYQKRWRDSLIHASTKSSTTRNVSSFIARRSKSVVPSKRPRSAKFTWPETKNPSENEEHEGESEGRSQCENQEDASGVQDTNPETVFDEPRTEPERSTSVAVLDVDWDQICESMSTEGGSRASSEDNKQEGEAQTFKDATMRDIENEIVNDAHHRAAENEMCRLFHQEWFNDFEILGQFNRGFIITRLRNDLFIIDQHASDEKYNFEDLQRNTLISKQRLVQPLGLEFSSQDELLILQHLNAFRAGGFDIEYREENPPTRRLFLKAQPISKHTIFVQDDLRDIVDMLKSHVVQGSSMEIKMLRPPRVRAMFASRACRKSIMIGTALQKPQMVKIVRKLATLEHPWTCPHGRPTMRHLCSLPS